MDSERQVSLIPSTDSIVITSLLTQYRRNTASFKIDSNGMDVPPVSV